MAKHLVLKLLRAKNIKACTPGNAGTKVFARIYHTNTVFETSPVVDMGKNPEFEEDGSNVIHVVYEKEEDFIALELFNRNKASIGTSRLCFKELANLVPGQPPEVKILPVMTVLAFSKGQKQAGELVVTAQIKLQQAMGTHGNLNIELKEGRIPGLTSILTSKTTQMQAKLTYKHTKRASGILKGMGNRFVWHEDNNFTFIVNSPDPDDMLEIDVYNKSTKVGQCKIKMLFLIEGDEPTQWFGPSHIEGDETQLADSKAKNTRKAELLVNKTSVGSIEVVASFAKTIPPRNSHARERIPSPELYNPPPWQRLYQQSPLRQSSPPQNAAEPSSSHRDHRRTRKAMSNMYLGSPSSSTASASQTPWFYPPPPGPMGPPGLEGPPGLYEPSAPPAPPTTTPARASLYPPVACPPPDAHHHAHYEDPNEAHGAPPVRWEGESFTQSNPELANLFFIYH